MNFNSITSFFLLSISLSLFSCTDSENNEKSISTVKAEIKEIDPMKNKGIGPVKNVQLNSEVDQKMAEAGKALFNSKCIICHKVEDKYIGPSPKGILKRRTPEWVMNMILNPNEMLKKDPIGQKLLKEYKAPMPTQGLNKDQAREIVEYFRTLK